jgi:hypothetical protein
MGYAVKLFPLLGLLEQPKQFAIVEVPTTVEEIKIMPAISVTCTWRRRTGVGRKRRNDSAFGVNRAGTGQDEYQGKRWFEVRILGRGLHVSSLMVEKLPANTGAAS